MLLKEMKLLNYENVKNKLWTYCQFHQKKMLKVLIMIL